MAQFEQLAGCQAGWIADADMWEFNEMETNKIKLNERKEEKRVKDWKQNSKKKQKSLKDTHTESERRNQRKSNGAAQEKLGTTMKSGPGTGKKKREKKVAEK